MRPNSSYGRFQNLIFLFKISMCKRKNFFEIYNLDTPSKRFVCPTLRSQMCVYIHIYSSQYEHAACAKEI